MHKKANFLMAYSRVKPLHVRLPCVFNSGNAAVRSRELLSSTHTWHTSEWFPAVFAASDNDCNYVSSILII